MQNKRFFKGVIYLFCCQGHFKMFLVKNMKMTHIVGVESHAICVIMTHCVRKSICDTPYLPARYFRFQKIEKEN